MIFQTIRRRNSADSSGTFTDAGFVNEMMDFCMSHASNSILAMAFGGALALQPFLCGRKITEPGDLRTNLYLLIIANASSGKGVACKVTKSIASEINLRAYPKTYYYDNFPKVMKARAR